MSNQQSDSWSRREFLSALTLAGAAGFVGMRTTANAAEPAPETTRLKLMETNAICMVPVYVAAELLRGEGFTDVKYVKAESGPGTATGSGDIDIGVTNVWNIVSQIDAGEPIVFLAGIHVGCFELFGHDHIRSISDLKGKSVAVSSPRSGRHLFLASMAAHVGLDPRKDIKWITHPVAEAQRLFTEGKIDAFMAFPPEPQELRAKKIGHVVVNTTLDRPWSQYFCCMAWGNREFVRKNPVATKRALRAILKANHICVVEPERVARLLVDKGHTKQYDYALQTLKEIPYGKWREYDAEDTVRFYSLRLNEAGMIKSTPQKIMAQGTDWRFWKELKKELKG
jgi:NitT/TauT family transport system substrate-binding protein